MTLSKDGNPEIYVLNLASGALRRLTRHAGIDTEPTWSPTGRQIAFVSDRAGSPHVYVMDAEGANVRQLTSGGFHTQPRWSPRGDVIAYTQRAGTHDIWVGRRRRLESAAADERRGDNQGPTWAPNGRHLAFQSNRLGRWQIFAMLADGTAPDADHARRDARAQVLRGRRACRDRIASLRAFSAQSPKEATCVSRGAHVTIASLLVIGCVAGGLREATGDHPGVGAGADRRGGHDAGHAAAPQPAATAASDRGGTPAAGGATAPAAGAGDGRARAARPEGVHGGRRAEGRLLRLRQVRHPARATPRSSTPTRAWLKSNAEPPRADRGALRRARHQRVQPRARRASRQVDDELPRLPGRPGQPHHDHQLRRGAARLHARRPKSAGPRTAARTSSSSRANAR